MEFDYYLIVGPSQANPKTAGQYFVSRVKNINKKIGGRGVGRTIAKPSLEAARTTAVNMRKRDKSQAPIRFIDATVPLPGIDYKVHRNEVAAQG